MKCAIYHGAGNITIEERPIPEITDDDVLVKNRRAGICGSDVGIFSVGGQYYGVSEGSQLGHEMVGEVVKVGANVTGVKVGDLVFVEPNNSQPGGLPAACMTGGFSEYVRVYNAKVGYNLYLLGDNANLDEAVIIEPMSVGFHAAFLHPPKETDNIVVLGGGPIGLGAAAGLIGKGIKNVVVVDRHENKLALAEKIGAKTVNLATQNLKDTLIAYFGTAQGYFPVPNVDRYIVAIGSADLFAEVFGYARFKTEYCLVGIVPQITIPGQMFIAMEPCIYGSQGYSHEDITAVIEHILNKYTCVAEMVTQKFKHEDYPKAIAFASDRSTSGERIKVIVDYDLA